MSIYPVPLAPTRLPEGFAAIQTLSNSCTVTSHRRLPQYSNQQSALTTGVFRHSSTSRLPVHCPVPRMIYNMSTQKPPFDYEWELYERYRETFEEYITSTILPSLREKHEEIMLSEFVRRWSNHCIMVRWLSRFFSSLDRRFIATKSLPSLKEVGNTCFTSLVYQEFHTKVRNVVMSLIAKERDGEQIDLDLLKNVVNVFIDIGNGAMDYYEKDLEEALLKDTAAYYSRKASNWILEADYMSKVEECLERESERASHYLHSSSVPKLLEIVRHELLSVSATQMLQTVAL